MNKEDKNREVIIPSKNEKLAELFGILAGDGFINHYPKRQAYVIEVAGNKLKDREYLENYVSPLFEELFNLRPKFYLAKNQNTAYLVIRSQTIFNFIKNLNFPTGKKGNIKAPQWIIENDLFFKSFIRGLFDTDGHLCLKNKEGKKYPVIGITSMSQEMLLPVKNLLLNKGISSYFGSHKSRVNNRESTLYRVQISGNKNIQLFFEEIGSSNQRNLSKYKEIWG